MTKSAYVKISSPANIGDVMTECQVTVKSHPESNDFVRHRYQSAGNIYTRYRGKKTDAAMCAKQTVRNSEHVQYCRSAQFNSAQSRAGRGERSNGMM